jgi:hypothetical protein
MQGKLIALAVCTVLGLVVVPWWLQGTVEVAGRGMAQVTAAAEVEPKPTGAAQPAVRRDAAGAKASAPVSPVPGGVVVRGRCVNEDGGAVAGATIALKPVSDLPVAAEDARFLARSGSAGQFELELVPVARSYELIVRSEHTVPLHFVWRELQTGSVQELGDLVLIAGGRVAGRVVDPSGRPQAGVAVGLRRRSAVVAGEVVPQPQSGIDLWSQADGTFAATEPMAPGDWTAMVMFPHYTGALAGERANCHVATGATTSDVDLVCTDITGFG